LSGLSAEVGSVPNMANARLLNASSAAPAMTGSTEIAVRRRKKPMDCPRELITVFRQIASKGP
jgi:hypothetical protein